MPTQDEKIPNLPLTGAELKTVCLKHSREMVYEASVELEAAISDRMSKDPLFAPSPYTHPRAKVKISMEFIWSNRNLPPANFSVSVGDSPLEDAGQVFVAGTSRQIEIESPNLERLAAGITFRQVVSEKAKPGEIFPSVVEKTIPVNAEDYPLPKPPVDEDTTEFVAEDLGVPAAKRIRAPKKSKGGPK